MSLERQSSVDFLKNIQIASPCPMNWDDMARTSNEAQRFCGDCKKHVFSIDKLNAREAHTLIQRACATDASVCLRLFKRADGTIITDDCPVGLRRIRDSWRKLKSSAAAFMLLLGALPAMGDEKDDCKAQAPVLLGRFVRPKPTAVKPPALMGEPMMIDNREEALKIESIKAISDRIDNLNRTTDKAAVIKLRLNMAQEAIRKNQYAFASDELSKDLIQVKELPATTAAEKNTKSNLTKELLKEKLACIKLLQMTDNDGLRQQLNALQKAH